MALTNEQQAVVDYVKNSTKNELILVDSVAGSGKTTLLVAIANTMVSKKGLYLAYNKAIANSSSKKFPKNFECRTTHSLAYKATVKPLNLKIGFFNPKHITEKISYSHKYELVEDIRHFCLSKFLTYDDYAQEFCKDNSNLANKYLQLMADGKIDCTHDFYLKLFHIYLDQNLVEHVDYDIIMLDEAGDLNEVTLEIFKHLPAKTKIAVGDPHQNIYTFNHTINCFDQLKGNGTTFNLSQSFRVPEHIANLVQSFCQRYLREDMVFEGIKPLVDKITTRGYISRTNSGLIDKIIELNQDNVPYSLVRSAAEIFKIPLMVASLKYQGKIYVPEYSHLQDDVDAWFEDYNNAKSQYNHFFNYLEYLYPDDISLMQAIRLVRKHSRTTLFNAFEEAKKYERKNHNLTLLTAHSAKGLEFDEVMIAPDMNISISKAIDDFYSNGKQLLDEEHREAFNLYYVACTRSLLRLVNATYLTEQPHESTETD